ncbi:MAG: hypothetical protein WBO55_01575 [Rhizobiaceae bacterium]
MRNAMRRATLVTLASVATVSMLVVGGCSSTATSTSATSLARQDRQKFEYTGEVYLLRGLANVFSTGLDVMNEKFRRRGVNSRVDNHAVWETWARDIVARNERGQVSYPIIIMGHSLGGNACVQMARYLGDRGIKVSFVAAFDPTITTEPDANVDEVVNYYLPNGKEGNQSNVVVPGPGFTGSASNVDVAGWDGMNHFNIEKNDVLQVRVITKTMGLLKPTVGKFKAGDHL